MSEKFDYECEKHGKTLSVIVDGERVCASCAFEQLVDKIRKKRFIVIEKNGENLHIGVCMRGGVLILDELKPMSYDLNNLKVYL